MNELEDLFDKVSSGMRKYANTTETADRTTLLKGIADALVEARAHHYNSDGAPDWAGRTYAYRMWVKGATDAANITAAERTTLQAAIRWHVGESLRSRLTHEQLEQAGLKIKSPRQRNIEHRATRAESRVLIGPGPEITEFEDFMTIAEIFEVTLARVPEGIADTFTDEQRAEVAAALKPLDKRFSAVLRRVRQH